MNTRYQLFVAVVTAFTLLLAVPDLVTADVTEAQIAAARTPADHAAIAKSFEAEAAAAEARAKAHEAMARTYKAGGVPKGSSTAMVRHCDRLMKDYAAAAEEYRGLAAEHRRLAAGNAQ